MSIRPTISGFTFIRNGVMLGFPFVESIRSLLPLVDEFVVAVGASSDNTLACVQAIGDKKIRIIEIIWNERMEQRGFVYAQQKMIAQYACTSDWAFYLESDEILHENQLDHIADSVSHNHTNREVEALVFDYLHFYGSMNWLAISPAWYRRECRVIRNTIRSYAPDGQFWVVMNRHNHGRKPRAALANANIFHYGHVRKLEYMQQKINQVSKYWSHGAPKVAYENIDAKALKPFTGSHPAIILPWLQENSEQNFAPNPNHVLTRREKKHRIAMKFEAMFGCDLSKKHYTLVKN